MPFRSLPEVTECRFEAGEYIMRQGEPIDCVYYLLEGEVNRESATEGGHIVINTVKRSGEIVGSILGLLTVYDHHANGMYMDDFIAVTDCTCYRIPIDVLKRYLFEHPELLEQALSMSCSAFTEAEMAYFLKMDYDAPTQFCRFLMGRCVKDGDVYVLPKHFTNVEIGKFLSMHVVTVSRLISALSREEVVTRSASGLRILDFPKLREYAEGVRRLSYRPGA